MTEFVLPNLQKRVIIFAGGYGSGKTEVAVNYAVYLAKNGKLPLSIVDLDIVNPYFRSREAAQPLTTLGINVIIPKGEHCSADLPILIPEIRGAIENPEMKVILDVGGDDVGSRVLSSMTDSFSGDDYEFLMVLNANRPFTSDVKTSMKMIRDIEVSGRLKFTGLISNTHLIDETNDQIVLNGLKVTEDVSREAGIPIKFISARKEVFDHIKPEQIKYDILPLTRYMLKPWESKSALRDDLSKF